MKKDGQDCDSATLAPDVKFLREKGYELARGRGVDQFGHTVHVETVALLIPKQDKDSMFSNSGIEKKLWKEICDLAKQYDVDRVILFGSRARGDYKKVSDIDLAVSGGDVSGFSISGAGASIDVSDRIAGRCRCTGKPQEF